MTRMLLAGTIAALIVIILGPIFIRWAQRREFGQEFREDGPQTHKVTKKGTPTSANSPWLKPGPAWHTLQRASPMKSRRPRWAACG